SMAAVRRLVAAVAVVVACAGIVRGESRAENQAAIEEVRVRLERYVEQRKRLEAELPPTQPTDDRAAIDRRERALAARLTDARGPDERIFDERARTLFRRLVVEAVQGPGSDGARSSALDDNPGALPVGPNRAYPEGVALSTVPPAVLKALPSLPADLEYRFVGKHLIVRDVRANLVLDVVPNALP
ncbi:MAG TPA: hypothetical protein VKA21_03940, partial [Candidatus Binatia bacterium]|nr:hypothetical protein [Candidatus Binatia bacterium]